MSPRTILSIALTAACLLPSLTSAEDGARRAHFKEKYDANKDGKLDETERAAALADINTRLKTNHPRLFAKIDADKDGKISAEELKAFRAGQLERYDTNKDGKLDQAERDVRFGDLMTELKERHPKLFEKMDANKDGSVSREEAKAFRQAHGKGERKAK
jgi:Ca2+-binding EF-hand superfamily protein